MIERISDIIVQSDPYLGPFCYTIIIFTRAKQVFASSDHFECVWKSLQCKLGAYSIL